MKRFLVSALLTLVLALALPSNSYASNDLVSQEEVAAFAVWDISVVMTVETVCMAIDYELTNTFSAAITSMTDEPSGADHERKITLASDSDRLLRSSVPAFVGGYNVLKMPGQRWT